MPRKETIDESEIVAVLDTNVILDFVSAHNAYEALQEDDAAIRAYRWQRTGDALRLIVHLNEQGLTTASYDLEAADTLAKKAPPGVPGFKTAYVQLFIWFIWDLLPDWNNGELKLAGNPSRNAADRALVAEAKKLGVPLISQERDPKGAVLKHAAKCGVQVLTPAQFCGSGPSKGAIEHFMTEFHRLGPSFHKGQDDHEDAQHALEVMYTYYVSVFEETVPDAHRRDSQ